MANTNKVLTKITTRTYNENSSEAVFDLTPASQVVKTEDLDSVENALIAASGSTDTSLEFPEGYVSAVEEISENGGGGGGSDASVFVLKAQYKDYDDGSDAEGGAKAWQLENYADDLTALETAIGNGSVIKLVAEDFTVDTDDESGETTYEDKTFYFVGRYHVDGIEEGDPGVTNYLFVNFDPDKGAAFTYNAGALDYHCATIKITTQVVAFYSEEWAVYTRYDDTADGSSPNPVGDWWVIDADNE